MIKLIYDQSLLPTPQTSLSLYFKPYPYYQANFIRLLLSIILVIVMIFFFLLLLITTSRLIFTDQVVLESPR